MDDFKKEYKPVSQSRITWKYIRDEGCNKSPTSGFNLKSYPSTITRHNGNHYIKKDNGTHDNSIKVPCLDNLIRKQSKNVSIISRAESTNPNITSPEKHNNQNDISQSPESQKKDELCSYLQLVKNSGTSQEHILIKERRSVRVKNLQILIEKKNLEKKLKSIDEDQTIVNELINSDGNREDLIKEEAPTEIIKDVKKYTSSDQICEKDTQRTMFMLHKRKDNSNATETKIKENFSIIAKKMKFLNENHLSMRKPIVLLKQVDSYEFDTRKKQTERDSKQDVIGVSKARKDVVLPPKIKEMSLFSTDNALEILIENKNSSNKEKYPKDKVEEDNTETSTNNLPRANKINSNTFAPELNTNSSSTVLKHKKNNPPYVEQNVAVKHKKINLPSTSSAINEADVVEDDNTEKSSTPLIVTRGRNILRKLLTKDDSDKKRNMNNRQQKRRRTKRRFKYVTQQNNSNNVILQKKRTYNDKSVNKIAYNQLRSLGNKSLRSSVRYDHLSMKKFMQIVNKHRPMKKKYTRKNKQPEKLVTNYKDNIVPLLDHNYAMCNGCTSLHEEVFPIKQFTTKEIICGLNQKENEEILHKNIITEIVQINKIDEVSNRKSILKEKLIFNTEAKEFEVPSSKCPLLRKNATRSQEVEAATNEVKELDGGTRLNSKLSKPKENEDTQNSNKKINFQHSFERQIEKLRESNMNNNIEITFNQKINSVINNHVSPVTLEPNIEVNSLYKSLIQQKQLNNKRCDGNSWNIDDGKPVKEKRLSHSIHVLEEHGNLLDAIYVDNSLIIVQELSITFYDQSPLGNVLGAQNMWIPKGYVQRLLLGNNGCIQKETALNVMSVDNSLSYIELWTKEHKSDKRERPVCDAFAAIYFMKHKSTKPDKKVLQLENINAFASDVRYIVKNYTRDIIVCWKETNDDKTVTKIRSYNLEGDYQTIVGVMEMQTVNYFITSLHNIEDGDDLLMGFGENKTTIWNLEYGYVIATIDIEPQPETLWVKCERGFLFTLQNTHDGNLRLVAIRGMNHSWKQLTVFKTPKDYVNSSLKGVCIEHGTIVAFYQNGVLCWNAQTGELLMEAESSNLNYFPSFKHVIITTMGQVIVKHALAYLITV